MAASFIASAAVNPKNPAMVEALLAGIRERLLACESWECQEQLTPPFSDFDAGTIYYTIRVTPWLPDRY